MFDIDVIKTAGFLRFVVSGTLDAQSDMEIDAAIARACVEHNARAMLIDIRDMVGRLSVMENHEAAKSFHRRMPRSLAAIAVVDSPEHKAQSNMFELTAVNRGINLKFFETVDDAQSWLGTCVKFDE